MKKPKIFIACDTTNPNVIKKVISHTKTNKLVGYKFGLEFFYSKNGRRFISKLKVKNLWLDVKIMDIPNTSFASIKSLKDLKNVSYITVHIRNVFKVFK